MINPGDILELKFCKKHYVLVLSLFEDSLISEKQNIFVHSMWDNEIRYYYRDKDDILTFFDVIWSKEKNE